MAILEFILKNENYLQDLITRSTYHSNAIEGSTLTYAETYAILYNDNSFKIEGKEPREIYEAINNKKALELVFKNLQNKEEFDKRFIKKLNEAINRDIKDTEGYRAIQVFVIAKEDRVKYFEFMRNNDSTGLAEWVKELSNKENERMEKFGYKE